MRVTSIRMLCVKQCLLDSALVRNLMLIYIVSNREPRSNKARCFGNMARSFFHSSPPECKIEIFYTTGAQQKIDCISVDWFCGDCSTVCEAFGCLYLSSEFQEVQRGLIEEDIVKEHRKREMDELRRCYLRKKMSTIEMWECQWKHRLKKNDKI